MSTVLLLGRLVLAAVLGTAGLAKLADRAGSRRAMVEFGVPERLAAPMATLLPLAELATAAVLLPATTARWGALAALVLLAVFAAAIGVNLLRGRRHDCHCFGQLHSAPAGLPTLARNVVLAGVAAFVLVEGWDDGGASVTSWVGELQAGQAVLIVVGLVLSILVMVLAWAVLNLLRQHGRLLLRIEALEARDGNVSGRSTAAETRAVQAGLPIGSAAPAFDLPTVTGETRSLGDLLVGSKPLLLVFTDPRCGPCSTLLPEVAHWQRTHAEHLTVALISTGAVESVRAKAREHALDNVLIERTGNDVAAAYHYRGTPSAVLVDARGLIASELVAGPVAIRSLLEQAVGHPEAGPKANLAIPSRPVPLMVRRDQLAPSFELPDLSGATRHLSEFRCCDTLLVFWNPGCGFCQRFLSDWKEWERTVPIQGRPQSVVVSTGAVADNAALGLRSPVLVDAAFEVGPRFGATGTPMAVLIDSQGRVASEVAAGATAVLALANSAHGLPTSSDAVRRVNRQEPDAPTPTRADRRAARPDGDATSSNPPSGEGTR